MTKTDQQVVTTALQSYGNLIITNFNLDIIAVSDSTQAFISIEIDQLLGSPLSQYIPLMWEIEDSNFMSSIHAIIVKEIPSQVFSKNIRGRYYNFKISCNNGYVYFEWEKQNKKHISVSRINELGFLSNEIYINNWNFLCKAIHKLIKFERVFITQIEETGQTRVIAEYLNSSKPQFYGKEFSNAFLPTDLMPYYTSVPYRYISNLHAPIQHLFSLYPDIPVLHSQLAPPPQIHDDYFKSMGIHSALFLPLHLDGKFWGMAIAHHYKKKKIDLQQRKLCSFIVHSAMSRFENSFRKGLIEQNQQHTDAEVTLKQSLRQNKTLNCAMVQNMSLLCQMIKADGLAIYNQGDLFFHGEVPSKALLYEIVDYLREVSDKAIFKDYNFKLNHCSTFTQSLPFAGLLYYTPDTEKDYYLIWFRKEYISSVVQLDITHQNNLTKVQTWEEPIYDSAQPWDDNDIKFVNSLNQIIKESIVAKATEKQRLNDELKSLNNELEMFTFSLSHDIKNPLSILKLGLQFLQTAGESLSTEKKQEWFKNLSGSVSNIESIINNIVTISQGKMTHMVKDPIPMSYTIQKIFQEAILLHNSPNCKSYIGKLLPLWGEKSTLYQVFLNIINNAIKYSCSQNQPKIWIDSVVNNNYVCYTVKDNGIGIPSETLPHIFDIFIRASNAQSFQGTGVGLSLVKRIMDRLGGRIEIKSTEGEGSTFKLYFPIVSDFPLSMLST